MTLNTESSLSHNAGVKTLYESDMEDENYLSLDSYGIRERRRKLHTEAEQRRRNAIKRGFEGLLQLIHPMKNESPSIRMSKSSILHKAICTIERLGRQKHQKLSELESLEKEVKALRILCLNYEKIVQNSPNNDNGSVELIPDDTKLEVFRIFFDTLFRSFESYIVFNSFTDLSASVIKWIEESCKPEKMAFLMDSVLTNIFNDNTEMSSIGGGRKFNLNTECSSSSNNNNTNHNHDSQNHRECMEPMLPSTESLLQTNPLLIGQSSVYTYSSNSNHQQQPQPPSLTPTSNIPNPIIIGSCEKHSPQLDSNSPRISQGNNNSSTSSTQLNLIRCPLAPCSSASDSAAAATAQPQSINRVDVNFQQCRQASDDILHSSSSTGSSNSSSSSNSNSSDPAGFYHYNSIIPKNVNSTLVIVDDQSSSLLLTDHPIQQQQPQHTQHPQAHDTTSSTASAHTTNTFCNVLMNEMNLLSSGEMSSLRNAASRGVQQQYKQFIDDLL